MFSKYSNSRLKEFCISDSFYTQLMSMVTEASRSLWNKKSWLVEMALTSFITKSIFSRLCWFLIRCSLSSFISLIVIIWSLSCDYSYLTVRLSLVFYCLSDFTSVYKTVFSLFFCCNSTLSPCYPLCQSSICWFFILNAAFNLLFSSCKFLISILS